MANPGARVLTSNWYGPLCIKIYESDMYQDPDWCNFLYSIGISDCSAYFPGTHEKAEELVRQFLIYKYGNAINEWAHSVGLGGRWKFEFNIYNENNGRLQKKCGRIRGRATSAGGGKTRKQKRSKRKQTRRRR
jgi:hypothetical protein